MVPTKEENIANVLKIFRKEKVMILKQLANLLKCCRRTVQRHLKQWQTYTSYNQNGRYYVLPDIPRFNQNGLWGYKGIFFSKYGNLRQTVIYLVNHSQAGFTGKEIEKIMRLSPNSFLSYFRGIQEIHCEKLVGRYVYFSSDKVLLSKQKKKRQKKDARAKLKKLPTDANAVIILVERIKYPHLNIEQLSTRLSKKGYRVNSEVIRNLFEYHSLKKKQNML